MAERSFKKEAETLRLGAGEEFHGEGILAVTKALLQSGVAYVAGYQGAPISHLMDVLTDSADCLYKTTDYYAPEHEHCLQWNDPRLAIPWPLAGPPDLSLKDQKGKPLEDAKVFA